MPTCYLGSLTRMGTESTGPDANPFLQSPTMVTDHEKCPKLLLELKSQGFPELDARCNGLQPGTSTGSWEGSLLLLAPKSLAERDYLPPFIPKPPSLTKSDHRVLKDSGSELPCSCESLDPFSPSHLQGGRVQVPHFTPFICCSVCWAQST